MNTMSYGSYVAKIEYDEVADLFHGEVINCKDVITFQGESVPMLHQAMKDSVDFYLDHCKAMGKAPETSLPGKFVLRFQDPQDHLKIYLAAKQEGKSVSSWARDHLLRVAEAA